MLNIKLAHVADRSLIYPLENIGLKGDHL